MDLQSYVRAVRRIPKLDKDQELELARTKNFDPLIEANLYIVVQIALGTRPPLVAVEDLIGEGNVALVESISLFDPGRNVKLCTFASHRIKAKIYQYINRKLDHIEAVSVAFDRTMADTEMEEAVIQGLSKLNYLEQYVIQQIVFEDVKLANIGASLGISAEAVRRIKDTAFKNIKRYVRGR